MESHEDTDGSDVYEDAIEGPPTSSSVPKVTRKSTRADPNVEAATKQPQIATLSTLPQWTLPTDETLPTTVSEALAPRCTVDADWEEQLPTPSSGIPSQWMGIVANDVVQMARNVPTSECDEDRLHYRLSDAYIAGMPAKRRRVNNFFSISVIFSRF